VVSFNRSLANRPCSLPGNGIAIAELGQQTASGIERSGVADRRMGCDDVRYTNLDVLLGVGHAD
jgi:hypothetical protein